MKYFVEGSTLSEIGNAIREKTGEEGLIPLTEFASKISDISGGGGGAQFFYTSFTTESMAAYASYLYTLRDVLAGKKIANIKALFLLAYSVSNTSVGIQTYSAVPYVDPSGSTMDGYYAVPLSYRTSSSSSALTISTTLQKDASLIFCGDNDPLYTVRPSTYSEALPIAVAADGTIGIQTTSTSSSLLGLKTATKYHLAIVYETN